MDEQLKKIMQKLKDSEIGLDEEFKFHCNMCGKCCIHREDIILNPKDIYSMSKELDIGPKELVDRYCEVYIGTDSRMPVVRLKPRGSVQRCPLLKDRKCLVHNAKPTVCAMFPIGRFIEAKDASGAGTGRIGYIFNDPKCGDGSESYYTVRQWLEKFKIPAEDEFFLKWHGIVIELVKNIPKIEKQVEEETLHLARTAMFVMLYLRYDTKKDFMPQFETNAEEVREMLNETVRAMRKEAGDDANDSI